MSELNTTTVEQTDAGGQSDTEETNAEIVSIKRGKLLKLRHHIESLRKQVNKESKEVEAWKNKTSETTKTLIGELNENIKREGSSD